MALKPVYTVQLPLLFQVARAEVSEGGCWVCGQSVGSYDELATHLATHREEACPPCGVCGHQPSDSTGICEHVQQANPNHEPPTVIVIKPFQRYPRRKRGQKQKREEIRRVLNLQLESEKIRKELEEGPDSDSTPLAMECFVESDNVDSNLQEDHELGSGFLLNEAQEEEDLGSDQNEVLEEEGLGPEPTPPIADPKKRFQCLFCAKAFRDRYKLSYHVNIHTGAKPFKCSVCTYRTGDRRNRDAHEKKIHKFF